MDSTAVEIPAPEVVPLWIDNQPVSPGVTFPVTNPKTGKVVWEAAGATRDIAQAAVDSAAKAFLTWSCTPPKEKRRIFLKAADLVRARRDEIIQTIVDETGSTVEWAAGINADLGAEFLEELASLATTCTMGYLPTTESDARLAMVFKEPYGVIVGIAPWNAPFILAIRAVAAPLICGNTAVLKASELSPKTHSIVGRLLGDAGLPPGVLNIIQHSREDAAEVVGTLISHPAVRKINFTGSTAVGRAIAQQAGRHLKPLLLELGGKASCIVLEDADLVEAARAVVTGGFLHHGQICMGTERVIVMRSIYTEFLSRLREEAAAFKGVGVAVTPAAAQKTASLVESAISQGARLEYGEPLVNGSALQPTILSGLTKDMDLFYTESFGPTISLMSVSGTDEAVALANDTEYGLSAAIFSRDVSKAIMLARRLQTGACHINAMTVHDEATLPHGGVKASGFGRFGAQWGMDEFLQTKTVTVLDTVARKL
ncbi:hypothetical protein PV04_10659 [Phialophora macrospora]|uniref:Aldehyde dehydrogenase domain-containing protein n=1 Tax=Phialophora macrospora TaxID=1851006 RepID=A0A0D2CBU4_9EURO|nr:hypothetical protein PV04_10659 [Phialophora macrospora]